MKRITIFQEYTNFSSRAIMVGKVYFGGNDYETYR